MQIFTTLVGVTFRGARARQIVTGLGIADTLDLEVEPDNQYDRMAIKVLYEGEFVGYIAKEDNPEIFRALSEGYELTTEIAGFESTLKPTLLVTWDD